MKVKRRKAVTYVERMYCDCGGEMEPTGMVLDSMPPWYSHACKDCGFMHDIQGKSYPQTFVVEELTEEEKLEKRREIYESFHCLNEGCSAINLCMECFEKLARESI